MSKVYILLMSYDHPQVPIDKYYYSALVISFVCINMIYDG